MVLKGQFLERPTLIPLANGLVLEGVSHRGDKKPGLLVLPPPPLEGGGMDHVVGAELAYAISRAGHPTLRFNYRGVGGSQGKSSPSPMDWLEDALAAHELARENSAGAPPLIATIGASDAVALKLMELQPIAGLALINPSFAKPTDFEGREKLSWPLGVVVGEHDDTQERGRWAAVLDRLEGRFTLIPGANRTFQRNLPMVGQAVASLFSTLTGQGDGGTK
ncbi:MAG: alpha/beta hydrolase [Archangium sp.]